MFKHGLWIGCLVILLAQADVIVPAEKPLLAEIERIRSINNNSVALESLEAVAKQLPTHASDELLYQFLALKLELHRFAAQHDAVNQDVNDLLALANRSQLKAPRVAAWLQQANQLKNDGHPEQALKLMRDALVMVEAVDDPRLHYSTYTQAGILYADTGDYENALTEYLRSLPLAEKFQQEKPIWIAQTLNNISTVYLYLKQTNEALQMIERAIPLAQSLNDQRMLATLLLNRGYAFSDLGRSEQSKQSVLQATEIARKERMTDIELTALVNLSDAYLKSQDFAQAEIYARRSLALADQLHEVANGAIARANVGIAMAEQGKVKAGLEELKVARQIFIDTGNLAMEDLLLIDMARLAEQANQNAEALSFLKDQLVLREKLFNQNRQKAVSEMQERFAASEKQKQIEKLEQENRLQAVTLENQALQRWVGALVLAVMILIVILAVLAYRRIRDVNKKLADANAQLADQSIRDPLTGLLNRRSFQFAMERRSKEAERRHKHADAVETLVLLDVDHFKQVNDGHGHAAGDTVLIEIGRRLSQVMRDSDMVLRWGGEEFLIYMPSVAISSLNEIVSRILNCIGQQPINTEKGPLNITVSAGFVPLPFAGQSDAEFGWERAVQLADAALYLSKMRGRNQAFGVMGLDRPYADIAEKFEQDFAQALEEHWVKLLAVPGPVKSH